MLPKIPRAAPLFIMLVVLASCSEDSTTGIPATPPHQADLRAYGASPGCGMQVKYETPNVTTFPDGESATSPWALLVDAAPGDHIILTACTTCTTTGTITMTTEILWGGKTLDVAGVASSGGSSYYGPPTPPRPACAHVEATIP